MHRRVFASLVLAGLLPVSAPSPAAGEVEWLALDSARQHRVSEPVHGGQVVVYEAGSRRKPTVVLIHGLGQNGARDWAEVIPTLVADYHVLAVDQPGFGASDQANRLYSPDNQARAIHAALEAFAPDSFVLVGHSMGAAVSLAFAEFYPRRVRRLVLVDMAGVLQRSAYAEFLSRLGAQYFTGLRPGDDSWFGGVVRGVLRQAERMPVDFGMVLQSEWMRERFLGANPNAIAAYALVERDFSAALRGISVPTLLIWGADDPVAPLRTGRMAASVIPGARLAVIDGVGHTPMREAPDAFNALLREELRGGIDLAPFAIAAVSANGAPELLCRDEPVKHYTGSYRRLVIDGCRRVEIENANIGTLEVTNASLEIINSHVHERLLAGSSHLRMTGGSLRCEEGCALAYSSLDAAGVLLREPVSIRNESPQPAPLTLSVVEREGVSGPGRFVHELITLQPGLSWPAR